MIDQLKRLAKRAPYLRHLVRQRDEARADLQSLQAAVEGRKFAFAQWGEDQILAWLFQNKAKGFYVDIGAFHPNVYSNTRLLFDRGWSGINVDCNPTMIEFYRQLRPHDVNLNVAVGASEGVVKFYFFHDWASSNTISARWADATSKAQSIDVKREMEVPCLPLRALLEQHLPDGRAVDFLNVDVEAVDLEVLQSNDWGRYRPLVIAIEDIDFDCDSPGSSATYRFLREEKYRLVSRTIYTNFFADERRRGELNGCP